LENKNQNCRREEIGKELKEIKEAIEKVVRGKWERRMKRSRI